MNPTAVPGDAQALAPAEPSACGTEPAAGTHTPAGAATPPYATAAGTACTAAETHLAWSLPVATHAFGRSAHAEVAGLPGGPRGYLVLETVTRGLPRSQLALAHQLGVDKTAMTYLLDELEAAGLIERRPDPADRRARQVLITAEGHTALRDCNARLNSAEELLLAPLTPAERRSFRDMLERIANAAPPGSGDCVG
jgi:DNA-binding MarR family transcriptional regulator